MRVKLSTTNRQKLFTSVFLCKTITEVAYDIGVSSRTVRDWKNGKYYIPYSAFDYLIKVTGINESYLSPRKLPEFWHIKKAAQKGARRRMELYGNFGTPEGRRLGGLRSIKINTSNKNFAFKRLKTITKPKKSPLLAEFMGIIIGDGHLSNYQVLVTTNSKTDKEHALFIQKLIWKLFSASSTAKEKPDKNAVNIVVSSKALVNFLNFLGMPIGNKIINRVMIPSWIMKNNKNQKAFLRGLFDTDGCVYIDKHKTPKKIYHHLGWTITSYAGTLRKGIIESLCNLGFSPTNTFPQNSVFMRKQSEIHRYFKIIGTSNPKHFNRYQNFIKRQSNK